MTEESDEFVVGQDRARTALLALMTESNEGKSGRIGHGTAEVRGGAYGRQSDDGSIVSGNGGARSAAPCFVTRS